jgi:hypothetical protein
VAGQILLLRDAGKPPHCLHPVHRDESCTGRSGKTPEKWPWSSAAAHISGQDDELVKCRALLDIVKEDWKSFLLKGIDTETIEAFRKHERTGRPIGDDEFIEKVEKITGRRVKSLNLNYRGIAEITNLHNLCMAFANLKLI